MDRNIMRSSYISSGPRSLPHMGSKRHAGNGHNSGHNNGHGNSHSSNGHRDGARLSPPAQNNNPPMLERQLSNQQDDIINYIYESWNKVTRELERGSQDARYYQEVITPRQLANFRPFNFDEWWGRRKLQSINRQNHRAS